MSGELKIAVETQSFRITPTSPIEIAEAIKYAGAKSNGAFAVIEHDEPRAFIVIDLDGSLLVHGISNEEAATMIAEKILLQIGLSESGLTVERGDLLASFSLGRAVLMGHAADRFSEAEHDLRLDALKIQADRHKCTIILFSNGRGIVMGISSRRVAEMAVEYWLSRLQEEGALA